MTCLYLGVSREKICFSRPRGYIFFLSLLEWLCSQRLRSNRFVSICSWPSMCCSIDANRCYQRRRFSDRRLSFSPKQLHRLGLVWCERAAPPLLLADDSGEGGSLWRDCLAIVRNLTLLNNTRASGGTAGPDGSAEEAIAKESAALCDNTVVLDGEGMRSALRLAAHPVNAPAKELLGLLESLVLRCASKLLWSGAGCFRVFCLVRVDDAPGGRCRSRST